MVTASAPGQIFLFGEHAVVYGQMALAAAIDRYTKADVEIRSDNKFRVDSKEVGELRGEVQKLEGTWSIQQKTGDVKKLSYVTKAAELTFNYIGRGKGLNLQVESDFPIGSGLGSSSAVSVAIVAAISETLGEGLKKEEISKLAFDAEMAVQGVASKTGVTVATYGDFVKVRGERVDHMRNLPRPSVIVGHTGVYASTSELIEMVKELKESHQEIFESALGIIGEITKIGAAALRQRDFRKMGALMNANQMLLELLGASSPELNRLISAAREAGALGAKLTGAGGGGSMIALRPEDPQKIARAIEGKKGQAIVTKIGVGGLRVK